MHAVSEIIKKFTKGIGIKESHYLTSLKKKWTIIVGEVIANHTYPSFIKGNILHIKVDSPQWIHHLSFLQSELLEKLTEFNITELRLSVGKLSWKPKINTNKSISKLTEKDIDFIKKTTCCLKDDETREALESLMKKSLSQNQQHQNSSHLKKN